MDGLKIKNIKAGTLYGYNLGTRVKYDTLYRYGDVIYDTIEDRDNEIKEIQLKIITKPFR